MSSRPWLDHYPAGLPADIAPEFDSMLDLVAATVCRSAEQVAIAYFDGALTYAELDRHSDALAVALTEGGFGPGDRLAIYLQNDPAFVIGLVASWKAGGAAVLINPMNKGREVRHLLRDSGAVALLCLDDLFASVAREVIAGGDTNVRQTFVGGARDFQSRTDLSILPSDTEIASSEATRLFDVIARYTGATPAPVTIDPDAPAVLTYTSGTTGQPKGAVNTHRGIAFNSQTYREWLGLDRDDVILGIAPLFHITGLVGHVGAALLGGCTLVLTHRFDPEVVLNALREHRPTFTIGAITAFNSLSSVPGASVDDFRSLRAMYSGGAPISPELRDRIRAVTGADIHNIYGMTETNSPTHAVPLGVSAPINEMTGALSIGVPVFNTTARIVGEDRQTLPPGEVGEIVVSGPQVIPGYWNRPDQTAEKIIDGELYTGDVGLMDDDGWFYVVDRKTDMIIASGYKVWPREVEDVLMSHAAVREAAVVGVPDEYRGETVKAFVSLRSGADATAEELTAYCKARMAAYKYPRSVELLSELPKSGAGKILRRELREGSTPTDRS